MRRGRRPPQPQQQPLASLPPLRTTWAGYLLAGVFAACVGLYLGFLWLLVQAG